MTKTIAPTPFTNMTKTTTPSNATYCLRPVFDDEGDMYVPIIQILHSLGIHTADELPQELCKIFKGLTALNDVLAQGAGDDAVWIDVVSMASILTVDYLTPESLALWQWFESTYLEQAHENAVAAHYCLQ